MLGLMEQSLLCGRPHQLVGPSVRLLRLSSDRLDGH